MARKKVSAENAIDLDVVSTFFVEEDSTEEAIEEQRQRFSTSINIGNGCYLARAHALSDER